MRRMLELRSQGQTLFSVTGEASIFENPAVQSMFFTALWWAMAQGPGLHIYVYDGERGQQLG